MPLNSKYLWVQIFEHKNGLTVFYVPKKGNVTTDTVLDHSIWTPVTKAPGTEQETHAPLPPSAPWTARLSSLLPVSQSRRDVSGQHFSWEHWGRMTAAVLLFLLSRTQSHTATGLRTPFLHCYESQWISGSRGPFCHLKHPFFIVRPILAFDRNLK